MNEQETGKKQGRFRAATRWLRHNWTEDAAEIWGRGDSERSRLHVAWIESLLFVREVLRELGRSGLMASAASLSYATLLSMIPLLVAFSIILRSYFGRTFPDFRIQLDVILTMLLPYRSAEVTSQIQKFVENAETATTLGVVLFVVIAFRLFMVVEETVNEIWKVPSGRSYQQQIRAFTMLLFWGPLLITLSFTSSTWLERNVYMDDVIHSPFITRLVPVGVLFIAFTMMFWLVPATRVRFMSAAFAGSITAILFEMVRFGFGRYADVLATGRLNVIYGTLGLLVIFLLALELMWMIVLSGVVISYVHQNMEGLIRATAQQLEDEPRYDTYFALRALVEIGRRYAAREDAPSSYRLAQMVNATDAQMLRILRELEDNKIVKEIGGDWTGWVPGGDPDGISIAEVVSVLERHTTELPDESPTDELTGAVTDLLRAHENCIDNSLGNVSLGDLMRRVNVHPAPLPADS